MKRYVWGQRSVAAAGAWIPALALGALLVCAGCGPWIDPDDPASVALACGDLRAVMATVADVALAQEEADAACATRIAEVFEAFATAVRENSAEAAGEAVDKILKAVAKEQDYRLYRRLLARATERVSERLEYMGEAPEDDQAATVAKRLTLAALDGVAEGARDYAAGLSP